MIIFDIDDIIFSHYLHKNCLINFFQVIIIKNISRFYPRIEIIFLTSYSEIYRHDILKIISKYLNCSKNEIDLTMNPIKEPKLSVDFKEQVGYDLGFKNIRLVYGGDKRAANMWISHGITWVPNINKNWREYK